MESKARCIYHVPNHIDPKATSGSQVRPIKMLQAFMNIGYDVDVVMGYGKERKKSIEIIKSKIRKGIKYDFLYSESSTMPTLLTEKNHFPRYPFLDFGFFKFCKKFNIKIGLFYRDIRWKFDSYKDSVSWYKRMFSIPMYKYDLKKYNKYLDVMYIPTMEMGRHIYNIKEFSRVDTLPPGAECRELSDKSENYSNLKETLNIFYVGGVTGIYDFEYLLKTAKKKPYIRLKICCREQEWEEARIRYQKYLTDRVEIVHKTGEALKLYYEWADICSCYFKNSVYMDMAVPVKLLEYVSYGVPVIATKGTVAGAFVEKYDCGYSIPFDEEALDNILDDIYRDRQELLNKYNNIRRCVIENTWEKRAEKVVDDLKV